jgi:hypothetical protein
VPRLTRSRVTEPTAAASTPASQLSMGLRLQHDALIADVLAGRGLGGHLLRLTALMTLASAAYGAVLGLWHGPLLASYVAVKFPLVMIVTSAVTLLLSYVLAQLLGMPLRLGQVAVLIVLGLSSASVLLASLAPVAWIFTLAAPLPSADARAAHNWLYLMHTAFVGGSGLAGSLALLRGLRATGRPPGVVARVYLSWVLAYAFVGGEVAWALRPFVGSIYFPVVFLRGDALQGNVYEFIVTDILPYLLSD